MNSLDKVNINFQLSSDDTRLLTELLETKLNIGTTRNLTISEMASVGRTLRKIKGAVLIAESSAVIERTLIYSGNREAIRAHLLNRNLQVTHVGVDYKIEESKETLETFEKLFSQE